MSLSQNLDFSVNLRDRCHAYDVYTCGATPVTDIIDNANVGRIHLVQQAVLAFVRDLPALTVDIVVIYRTVCRAASIVAAKDLALKHRMFKSPLANLTVMVSVMNLRWTEISIILSNGISMSISLG